jgi:hypothetical protein
MTQPSERLYHLYLGLAKEQRLLWTTYLATGRAASMGHLQPRLDLQTATILG